MTGLYFTAVNSASFLESLFAVLSSGLGALLAVSLNISHRHLCALISLAAGTLFAATAFHILPESFHYLPVSAALGALISGYILFYLISRYVFHVCPACAASHFDEHVASGFKSFAAVLAIALGIHILMDGMAIATGHEFGRQANRSIFATITIHKFPEGMALCALLFKAGFPKAKALMTTLSIESLTLVGWALGIFLLRDFAESSITYLLLAHIGGGFIYLAVHAVLSESKKHSPLFILSFFLIGMIVIGLGRWLVF